jgi:hypothetical protein
MAASQRSLSRFAQQDQQTRSLFIEAFDGQGSLPNQSEECVVNEDQTAMWVPADEEPPITISTDTYADQEVGEWERGKIELEDENHDLPVIKLSIEGNTQVLNLEYVVRASDAADTDIEGVMANARAHQEKPGAPVLFEMPTGRVMLAPRIVDPDEVEWEGK